MAKVLTLNAGGISTDPPSITAGKGTMTKANNVIITRPNVVEPRPAFVNDQSSWVTGTKDFVPTKLIARNDADTFFVGRTAHGAWALFSSSSLGPMTGNAEPPSYSAANTGVAGMRGNTYLTTSTGIRKITGAPKEIDSGTPKHFEDAGLPPMPTSTVAKAASSTTEAVWLGQNETVAYQCCLRREDGNGVTIRSAPSPWITHTSTDISDTRPELTIQLPIGTKENDVIEVYRSRIAMPIGSTPTTPTADLYLVEEIAITSAMASDLHTLHSGVSYVDNNTNQLMGMALYTSPSQEGALGANYPPPKSLQVASWKNCMWYADTRTKHYVNLALTASSFIDRTPLSPVPPEHTAPAIVFMTVANATAQGGNDYFSIPIDGVNPALPGMEADERAQLAVGMGISASSYVPIGTHITNIEKNELETHYKITIDQNLTGTFAISFTASFHDVVKLTSSDHTQYEFWASDNEDLVASDDYRRNFICTANEGHTIRSLARVISASMPIPGTYPQAGHLKYSAFAYEDPYLSDLYGTMLVQRREFDYKDFEISSTKPGALKSRKPSESLSSATDERTNRVYFSKVDQPDHVSVTSWLAIGDGSDRIMAMTPLDDQLVCWTEKGVYSITGYGPSNWRVDAIDKNLRLLSPEAQCSLAGTAFGWTNIGIVRIGGGSVRGVSAGAVFDKIESITRQFTYGTTGSKGIFMTPHLGKGLLVVGVPSALSQDKSDYVLVYCLATNSWTTWSMEARDMVYNSSQEALVASLGDTFELRYESHTLSHDGFHYLPVGGVGPGGVLYLESGAAWTPAVDDLVTVGDSAAGPTSGTVASVGLSGLEPVTTDDVSVAITTEDASTGVTVPSGPSFTMSPAFTGESPTVALAYEAISCELEWNVHTLGDPGVATNWQEMQVQVCDTEAPTLGPVKIQAGAACERSPTVYTTDIEMPDEAIDSRPFRVRFSREVHRSAHLRPYIKILEAGWKWKLAGIGILASKAGRSSR